MICRLARYFGDDRTGALLDSIAQKHTSERIRTVAYESLAAREPHLSGEIWQRALADKHPGVRHTAIRALEQK
ncbi:MAG TPA: hypothetical protein VFK06_00735 [Candidatus Angelobacter sp.]|nr:hypothetical protein [Candidatus Angelobacter sp.]